MADELGRADHEWRIGQESFLSLSTAAALAFHQAQGGSARAILSREDHDDALNIAASALSRLTPIYVMDEAARAPVAVKLDVANGRFRRGATEFHRRDGTVVVAMTVRRGDLTAALSHLKRVGVPFRLALGGEEGQPEKTGTPADRSAASRNKPD
jgi:hypothetical protein